MMAAKYRPHVRPYACPCSTLLRSRNRRERRRLLARSRGALDLRCRQDVDIALAGVGVIAEQTPGFCALAESTA